MIRPLDDLDEPAAASVIAPRALARASAVAVTFYAVAEPNTPRSAST